MEANCNPVFSHYKFHRRVQTESETVEKFVSNLKVLVRECSFKEPNKLFFWNKLSKFEKKLLNQGKDLTLDKAIHIGQTYEMSGSQMK